MRIIGPTGRDLPDWRSFGLITVISSLIFVAGVRAEEIATLPFMNASLSPEQRAMDLVHRMTLQEKASQLVNQARAIPRLGVPAYDWWSEALHGVIGKGTTEFPQPIGLAATFDAPAIREMATAIGTEGRIKHAQAERDGHSNIFEGLDFWAPNVNIFRDPRWGRGQETYGEDPFLSASLAVAFVTGMQGTDPNYYRAISTPKHFAVHSGPEPTRHFADVDVSRHDEEDTFLPAFRAAVVEGHAGSVMCAYNAINGEPACASQFLLQHILRDAWHFQGYVVSDCGAVRDIFNGHHFRATQSQSSAIALERGMDNECIDFWKRFRTITITGRILRLCSRGISPNRPSTSRSFACSPRACVSGMFDPPSKVPYASIDESELDSAAHRALAGRLADESMVLLKNDGILPLKAPKRIAIVGPLARTDRRSAGQLPRQSHPYSERSRGNEGRISRSEDPLCGRNPVPVQSGRSGAAFDAHDSRGQARAAGRIWIGLKHRFQARAIHGARRASRRLEREQYSRAGERQAGVRAFVGRGSSIRAKRAITF